MNHSEWLSVCGEMSRLWPRQPMPPEACEAWYPLLADLDGQAVREAVKAIALEPGNQFPPSLGDLRAAAEPCKLATWEQALAEIRALVHKVGAYRGPPEVDDPVLAELIEVYGWQSLCAMNLADSTARAQFRDTHRSVVERIADKHRRRISREVGSGPALRAVEGGSS